MTSIVIGTIVAALGSHFPLRPLNTLIEAMNQLAHGKYDIRINLGKHRISQELLLELRNDHAFLLEKN